MRLNLCRNHTQLLQTRHPIINLLTHIVFHKSWSGSNSSTKGGACPPATSSKNLLYQIKMVPHRCSSNTAQNFYFYRLPRLWNSLPKIDLSLSTNIIKHKLYNYMWDHFMRQFNDTNIHTFHYLCPCCHCLTASPSPIYAVLLEVIIYCN